MHKSISTFKRNINISNLLLFLYFVIISYLVIIQDVWVDEAYSLHTTSKDLNYAFTQAVHFESQAPLYFIILKLWRYINDSVIFARFLSVLFIIASIFLSKKLSKRYIPGFNPYYLMFMVAINPFTVWSVRVIRVYPLVILLSIIILIIFHKVYLTGSTKIRDRVLFSFLALFSIFTHYFMAFLLAGGGLALLIYQKDKSFKAYVIDMIAPLLLISLFFYTIVNQYTEHTVHKIFMECSIPDVTKFIITRMEIFITSINNFNIESQERNIFRIILLVVLIIMAFFSFNKARYKEVFKQNYTLPMVISISLIFFVFQYISGCMLLSLRHMSVLFIPLLTCAAFTIPAIYKNKAAGFLILIIIIIYTGANISTLTSGKTKGLNEVTKFIIKNEKQNQPVLLYRNELALAFEYFYKGKNKIYPIPEKINFSKPYNDTSWVINSTKKFAEVIADIPSKSLEYWVINDDIPVLYGLNYNYDKLDSLPEFNFKTKMDTTILNMRVRLLEKIK